MYAIENYKESIRFNKQYHEIRQFLQAIADSGYNEHFHWGRWDWMMAHSYLDVEKLTEIALFKNGAGKLAGAAIFDTSYDDRWYFLHSISDKNLLGQMIDYVTKIDGYTAKIKANLKDSVLCQLLENAGFERQDSASVLQIDLSCDLSFSLPQGFYLNDPGSRIDSWQWQLVLYRGFDHEGQPKELNGEAAEAAGYLETHEYIKTFAVKEGKYAAHCGVWYNGGNTVYIEPVVTVPEHRRKGLGRAVVYEAISRAKKRGAKRAIVLSDQDFYISLGMTKSSEVCTWARKSK